ncbi:MAG: Ig-like domain-containing protein [Bacillota bacterium]|nr:Ig-like domain-containing protein [Bacillota bacterium]
MKRKIRFVCIIILCIVLFSSELFRINAFATDLESGEETLLQNEDTPKYEGGIGNTEGSGTGDGGDADAFGENGAGDETNKKDGEKKSSEDDTGDEDTGDEDTGDNNTGGDGLENGGNGNNTNEGGAEDENFNDDNAGDNKAGENNGEAAMVAMNEENLEAVAMTLNEETLAEDFNDLQVSGTVELSSTGGVSGNTFTAQINIFEDIDIEDLYCKWVYEENDVALLTESSALDEVYTFKVINTASTKTRVSVQIYIEDVCIGTLTSEEYAISSVNVDQVLSNFTVKITDNISVDLMSTGECVVGGELDFSVELNKSYIESLDYTVEKVIVTYASNTETMEEAANGQYSKLMNVLQAACTEDLPKITIIFDSGLEIAISANKTLRLDKEAPIVNVSLISDKGIVKKEWLSRNDGYESLQLKIDVKDASEIAKCKVTSTAVSKEYTTDKIGDSYYVNVDLKEQIAKYTISVEDARGNCSEAIYTVKIDNTKPSEKVKVLFSGNQEIICEEEIEDGYYLGEGQGNVCSDDHITMDLEVEDIAGISGITSGINKIIVDVLVTTTNGERVQGYTFQCNGEREKTVSFCINKDQPEPEMNYQIKQVYIEDYAGNSVELLNDAGCIDDVVYAVDNRAPIIEYNYADGIIDSESEDIVYYGEAALGTVEISDLNLNQYRIKVTNVEEYNVAKIEEKALDDMKAVYSFALNEDGKYQINTEVNSISEFRQDEAINQISKTMIVDTIAPIVDVKLFSESGRELTNYANQYYKENIYAEVSVIEKNVELIEVKIYCEGSLQSLYTQDDFTESAEEEIHKLICALSEEGEYYLEVSCKDKTGKEATFQSDKFTIDKTAPKVTITYDNNNAKHEFYYNAERAATIKVEDIALNKENIELKIETMQGSTPELSAWSESAEGPGKVYTAQINFTQDDIYDVSFACEDMAGNRSEECDGGHFVIDRTSPIVSINYDNYSSKNEVYYKEDRTAIITVEDLSFDKDSFIVSNSNEEDVVSVSESGNWQGSDIYYTTEIMCNEEGIYQFSIYAEDLAGNEAVSVSSEYFIIDKTAPEIEITGVTHESANQGDVVPVISYKDKYLDDDNSNIILSGYKNGVVTINTTINSDEESRSVQYDAFPKAREMDDVYTLTVHIEDKAGNQSEEEYLFSVNRFGSTFSIDKPTAELVDRYYTNKEQDVVITEVNVDNLQQEEITISFNGEPRTLKKGVDYKITSQGSNATWKSYTYTVFKNNFEKEGQYIVSVFSKDTAENQSDNNVQDLEIVFAVDKTAPSIVVTNLEDDGVYSQSEQVFNMDIKDNMCLESACLLINGKEVQSYGQEELIDAVSYKLTESDEPMDITIRAADVVGNISEKKFNNILLSQNINTIEETGVVSNDVLETRQIDETLIQTNVLRMGFILVPVAAILLITSTIALQKKKEQEKS